MKRFDLKLIELFSLDWTYLLAKEYMGHGRLKKSMLIENLCYFTIIEVIVDFDGIWSASSFLRMISTVYLRLAVDHRVLYKHPVG